MQTLNNEKNLAEPGKTRAQLPQHSLGTTEMDSK